MKRDILPPYEEHSSTAASSTKAGSQEDTVNYDTDSDVGSYLDQRPSNPTEFPTTSSTSFSPDCCDILPHLPAAWTLHQSTKFSALAATVLIKNQKLEEKDLEPFLPPHRRSPSPSPTDPISGALIATHNIIGGVLHGVADYPIQLSNTIRTKESFGKEFSPTSPNGPKGVARIVGTVLKAPMDVTVNVARGFENVPGIWGDENGRGREREKIVGVQSGLSVAGKGFGYGLYDGITGIVTQPYHSAAEGSKSGGVWGGILGGITGFGKGIGGAVCKPAAGAVGLPAYAMKGVYEGVRGRHLRYSLKAEGEKGCGEMGFEDQAEVLRRWETLQSRPPTCNGKLNTLESGEVSKSFSYR